MNSYYWKVGSLEFKICTNNKKIKLPYYPITEQKTEKLITIFLEEDEVKKQEILKKCQRTWKPCFPKELDIFYEVINKFLETKINFKNHVNSYYQKDNNIVGYFPYLSDDFILHYSYKTNNITLYGNEINLYRILMDFLTVYNNILPLHASSLKKENNVFTFISGSGGGKTSLILKLLQKDFEFITDDSLFISEDKIIPVSDQIAICKKFPNHPVIEKMVKNHKTEKTYIHLEKIAKIAKPTSLKKCSKPIYYYLQNKETSWRNLYRMKEPFPCISHHSFWCLHYFVTENQKQWAENRVEESFGFWQNQLENIKPLYLNFENFEDCVEDFAINVGGLK